MDIRITPHPVDPEITLLAISGRLDTLTEPVASPQVLRAVEKCGTGVVFDLADLDFVSSAGLRLLLLACKNCAATGKKLAMVRAQPSVYKIFKLAGFEEAFNLHQDEAAAVETVWKKGR